MNTIIRNMVLEMTILLGGNTAGLTIHFMTHLDKFARLSIVQFSLLLLISLLIAGAEAIQHGLPENDERAAIYKRMTQFFLSLLITMMISDKPL